MIAVLADRRDRGAAAVVARLAAPDRPEADQVLWITPADLVRARWSHRVDASGRATNHVVLRDGRPLVPDAVLHRLTSIPARTSTVSARDRDYIVSEFTALVASWLLGLGDRVLGPRSAYATVWGLAPLAALAAAEQTGLPVARRLLMTRGGLAGRGNPREHHSPRIAWPGGASAPVPVDVASRGRESSRLLVIAGRAHGPLAGACGEQAAHLAADLESSVLELAFGPDRCVVDVTMLPALERADEVALVADALVHLTQEAVRT